MAKMKISFSYASLSGLTPFFILFEGLKQRNRVNGFEFAFFFKNRNLKAEGFILVQEMNRS